MNDPQQARRDLEDALMKRLQSAQAAYNVAKAEHERLASIIADVGLNHPDGSLALSQAVKLDRAALDAYAAALKDFTDLTIHSKPPGE
jgi:hypothetical protein